MLQISTNYALFGLYLSWKLQYCMLILKIAVIYWQINVNYVTLIIIIIDSNTWVNYNDWCVQLFECVWTLRLKSINPDMWLYPSICALCRLSVCCTDLTEIRHGVTFILKASLCDNRHKRRRSREQELVEYNYQLCDVK